MNKKEDIMQAKVEELRTYLSLSEEILLNELNDYIKNLQQENNQLKEKYLNAVADYETEKYKNSKAIEIIKLCNSKCAKETIEILKGEE